MLLDVQDQ